MWFQRLFFVAVGFIIFLDRLDQTDSIPFENFFIRSPRKCEERCNKKHGYFYQQSGKEDTITPVSTSKIKLRIKCSCKPSPDFKKKVVAKYGKWTKTMYKLWTLIGVSRYARKQYKKISFLTYDEYHQILGRSSSQSQQNKQLVIHQQASRSDTSMDHYHSPGECPICDDLVAQGIIPRQTSA